MLTAKSLAGVVHRLKRTWHEGRFHAMWMNPNTDNWSKRNHVVIDEIIHKKGNTMSRGSFTLTETDSVTDLESDSQLDGYIVLCRTFHIA